MSKMIKVRAQPGQTCVLPLEALAGPGGTLVRIQQIPVEVPLNNQYVQKRLRLQELVIVTDADEKKEQTK